MKKQNLKRFGTILLTCIMLLCSSVTVLAAEISNENEIGNYEATTRNDIKAYDEQVADIPAFGSKKFFFDRALPPLLGSSINVLTSSNAANGAVIVEAYYYDEPDIPLIHDGVMGVNDRATWNIFFSNGGTYVVEVSNHSGSTLNVRVWW